MVERRLRRRADRLYHRPPRLLDDRAGSRARRADPAPRQRDADRCGGRAFRGTQGRKRILDLGTGPGTLLLAALDQWPDATGLGVDASRRRWPMPRRNARRLGFDRPRRIPARRLGRGHRRALRPDPVQPALCRRAAPSSARASPSTSRDEALFAGADGLDAYRALAPAAAAPARPGRAGRDRDRLRPGGARSPTLLGARRPRGRARARPRPAGRAHVLLTWALNEIAWNSAVARTTSVGRVGPAPPTKAERIPPTPDAIGRSLRAFGARPEREGQSRARLCSGAALPARGEGVSVYCVRK